VKGAVVRSGFGNEENCTYKKNIFAHDLKLFLSNLTIAKLINVGIIHK
jgi:hypothetical protein